VQHGQSFRQFVTGRTEHQSAFGDAGQNISQDIPLPSQRFRGVALFKLSTKVLLPVFGLALIVLAEHIGLQLNLLPLFVQGP